MTYRKGKNVVLIALGANLPSPDGATPLETCRRAVSALDSLPSLHVVTLSPWYRTEPDPPGTKAPPFVNGVARLEGEAGDPAALLAALHEIETRTGRTRPFPNAPRTLDLDLIAIDDLVRPAPDPMLPHPRAHLRRFVLQPLADVAPGWRHPLLGRTVETLLRDLPGPLPERLDGAASGVDLGDPTSTVIR